MWSGSERVRFASQLQERLTEAGIHHWLWALKRRATKAEWDLIHEVTFHDLRHDFAHRAREALPGTKFEQRSQHAGLPQTGWLE